MAKGNDPHSVMACARQTDGINVIFDKNSPASSPARCESSVSCESDRSSESVHHRGRGSNSRRHRSSSSSSSSSSRSPRTRSRSHPRCHRPSSRCRCDNHFRYGRGRHPSSPQRRSRARSRSCSRSPLPNSYPRRRHNRSRSRSLRRYSRTASHSLQSSSRSYRSRSRSSERSDSLSLDDKKELLKAAYANSTKILGVDNLDLPESVKPILSEHWESKPVSPEPWTRVTQNPIKTLAQSNEEEPEDVPSPKLSQKGKISFSINNSVVKPTVVALSCAKVTPRMDIYESRKPYGHWVPVKSGRTSKARKHHLAMSH